MYRFLMLIFVGLSCHVTYGQVVSNVRLVDHRRYYMELLQTTMNDLEENGWCNLKLPEIRQVVNQNIYGWELLGNVTYKNGYLVSMSGIDIEQSTINQVWANTNGAATVTVLGTVRFHEAALGFDVELDLDNGEKHFSTGIYTHGLISFRLQVTKNIQTNEFTTLGNLENLSAGNNRRMIYLPSSSITEVLQRQYVPSNAFDGVNAWITQSIAPAFLETAKTKVQFPEICYNCNA